VCRGIAAAVVHPSSSCCTAFFFCRNTGMYVVYTKPSRRPFSCGFAVWAFLSCFRVCASICQD
jgi:hypothetical protein